MIAASPPRGDTPAVAECGELTHSTPPHSSAPSALELSFGPIRPKRIKGRPGPRGWGKALARSDFPVNKPLAGREFGHFLSSSDVAADWPGKMGVRPKDKAGGRLFALFGNDSWDLKRLSQHNLGARFPGEPPALPTLRRSQQRTPIGCLHVEPGFLGRWRGEMDERRVSRRHAPLGAPSLKRRKVLRPRGEHGEQSVTK